VISAEEAIGHLLNPNSIAIVGASNNRLKFGGRLIHYLIKNNYKGKIFPVNPGEKEVAGLPAYPRLTDIPDDVDLACLIVPLNILFDVLKDCVAKGVKAVIVNASGFAEVGEDGEQLQSDLVRIAREGGMRVCGPNTIGIFSPADNFFATFSNAMETKNVPVGTIGFITQSGAVGGSILSRAWEHEIGFSRCISSGNEADLTTADYIKYLAKDPATSVICLFLEGVSDGQNFRDAIITATEVGKPIVVFKNGRSEIGARAVKSHTGSLAGSDEVFQALCKQYGMLRVTDLEALLEIGLALSRQSLPRGNRMGILSTSGGACSIAVDNCMDYGLEVPNFSPFTTKFLKKFIPPYGSAENPVDTTAQVGQDAGFFTESIEVIAQDSNVDGLLLMLTTTREPLATKLAESIVEVSRKTDKPITVGWTIAPSLASDGMACLRKNGIPLYSSPERAVRAMAAMSHYNNFLQKYSRRKTDVMCKNCVK